MTRDVKLKQEHLDHVVAIMQPVKMEADTVSERLVWALADYRNANILAAYLPSPSEAKKPLKRLKTALDTVAEMIDADDDASAGLQQMLIEAIRRAEPKVKADEMRAFMVLAELVASARIVSKATHHLDEGGGYWPSDLHHSKKGDATLNKLILDLYRLWWQATGKRPTMGFDAVTDTCSGDWLKAFRIFTAGVSNIAALTDAAIYKRFHRVGQQISDQEVDGFGQMDAHETNQSVTPTKGLADDEKNRPIARHTENGTA